MSEATFSALISHPVLQKVLTAQGFDEPTAVQRLAIPAIFAGKNILVSSKTGSGKTAAFLLPAIQQMLEQKPLNATSSRLLVLTPTRELARQILKVAQEFTRNSPLRAVMIAGGEELKFQKALLRKTPDIVVATPGRLAEHIAHKSTDFTGLEVLVLDEADRMLEMGLSDDVLTIANACRAERQTLLFSATLEQKGLRHLIKQVMGETTPAEEIIIDDEPNRIQQQIILADDIKHKEKLLVALLNQPGYAKAVVFTNTKLKAGQLDGLLRYHHMAVSALHGDMTQDQRKRSLDIFRHNRTKVLVATDVAARGLDIDGVDLVINFDMPHSGDEYIHRIGRTGRADREGRAVSLIAANDWNLMSSIERYLKIRFEKISLPGFGATYQGPVKLKSSGKAAGVKKKVSEGQAGKKKDANKNGLSKVKVRERDKKNIGKRRAPSPAPVEEAVIDGFAPLKRKPSTQKMLPLDEE